MSLEGAKGVTCGKFYKMKNYWVRTRIETQKRAEERYREFLEVRNTLCDFCGNCRFPNIVSAWCNVDQLAERLRGRVVKDGIIKE